MHVIGARFDRAEAAHAALAELRDQLGLAIDEGAIQPLGSTEYDRPSEQYLLAGRFEDHLVAEVLAVVRAGGGVIVELRKEAGSTPVAMGSPPSSERSPERRVGNGRSTPRPPRPSGPTRRPRRSSRQMSARAPRPRRVNR